MGRKNMNKLKAWRLERGITQTALAEVSKVPRHVIQMAENGLSTPESQYQEALANSLGVSSAMLFPVAKDGKNETK